MKGFLLIILLLVVAGFGMFYIKSKLTEPHRNLTKPIVAAPTPPPTPTPSTSPSPDPSSPSGIVQRFYDAYNVCLENPPEQAGENVSTYCQANNEFASAGFAANIKAKGKISSDPILCAQNTPEKTEVQISTPSATASRINVEVIEYFGNLPNNIAVQVVKQKGDWKVNNITCPKP